MKWGEIKCSGGPIVGLSMLDAYLVSCVKLVIHEASDDARLSYTLVPKEHEFILGKGRHCRHICTRSPNKTQA